MIWDLSPPIVLLGQSLAPPAIGYLEQWYSYVVLPQGATHFSYHLELLMTRAAWRARFGELERDGHQRH